MELRISRILPCFLFIMTLWGSTLSKPVNKHKQPAEVKEAVEEQAETQDTGLAYDAYLRQVVEVLESDESFRTKLESANVSDIKSGKIAMFLEMVNHTVRTKLDEIKRKEITRLQDLVRAKAMAKTDPDSMRRMLHHLDLQNPHSFEKKDLETLIQKTTSDLEELDKQRKEEFKEYEMEKNYEEEERLKQLPEEERQKEKHRLEELKKKHAEHPKINHPGSKDQFEEVWDKVDKLDGQEFDPKTFFFQHDINGDMEWSIDEVDAVLQLELDKVYDEKNSPEEDDPYEREEEMNRMREHVFKEMDKNHDQRISLQEFLDYTGTDGNNEHFKEDDGWKTVDEEDPYTDEEYEEFLRENHSDTNSDDLHFQPEGQIHHQQQFQQPPQGQQQFQQPPQGQQQFQQPPQGQQQFQQPPQVQQQFQQPPQGQQQFQQPPQGQQQFQQPPQGQQAQGSMNQLSPEEQVKLQNQLKEMKEKLEAQQKNQAPPAP